MAPQTSFTEESAVGTLLCEHKSGAETDESDGFLVWD